MSSAFSGVVASLITPFTPSLDADFGFSTEVDTFRVASLTRWQARSGVAAVAVAGWAGEGSALNRAERVALIEAAVSAKGRMAVLAHVGTPSTAQSCALALDAEAAGADGLVLIMPFYNKPSFAGIRAHVEAIATATGLPLFLEFDEVATRVHLSSCQMAELSRIRNVAAMIDHSTNPLHVECMSRAKPGVAFLAAHDPTCAATALLGANGLFSAVANVAPELVVGLWRAICQNDVGLAKEFQRRLQPLADLVEAEGVAALKEMLHGIAGCDTAVRLPLHTLCPDARRQAALIRQRLDAVVPSVPVRPAIAVEHVR